MATKNDLALAVLEDLEVVAAGESPTAADSQLVIRRYNRLHEELVFKEIAFWESASSAASDTIPDRVMRALTKLMAVVCADAFGKVSDPTREMLAMNNLRSVSARVKSELPTQALYY